MRAHKRTNEREARERGERERATEASRGAREQLGGGGWGGSEVAAAIVIRSEPPTGLSGGPRRAIARGYDSASQRARGDLQVCLASVWDRNA